MPKDMSADTRIEAVAGKSVELPNGNFIANAEMTRSGMDLHLTGPGGHTIIVEGYFAQMPHPDLVTHDGAHLTPAMVNAFVPPEHAGQYAASGQIANDASPAGKITQVVGEAHIVHADGTKILATVGALIFQGDVIETSKTGAVNIQFADNTTFAISESARMSVDQFVYHSADHTGSTFFSMLQGVFVYTSGLIGKSDPGSVNIETPVGSIGIRGTVVAGHIMPAGHDSQITIVDGAVTLTNGSGTQELNTNLATVSLNSYQAQPETVPMDASIFNNSYHSVSSVASDTLNHFTGMIAPAPATEHAPATTAPAATGSGSETAPTTTAPAPSTTTHAPAAAPAVPASAPTAPTGSAAPAPSSTDSTAQAAANTAPAAAPAAPVDTTTAPPPPPATTSTFSSGSTTSGASDSASSAGTFAAPSASTSTAGTSSAPSTTTVPTSTDTTSAPATETTTTGTTTTPPSETPLQLAVSAALASATAAYSAASAATATAATVHADAVAAASSAAAAATAAAIAAANSATDSTDATAAQSSAIAAAAQAATAHNADLAATAQATAANNAATSANTAYLAAQAATDAPTAQAAAATAATYVTPAQTAAAAATAALTSAAAATASAETYAMQAQTSQGLVATAVTNALSAAVSAAQASVTAAHTADVNAIANAATAHADALAAAASDSAAQTAAATAAVNMAIDPTDATAAQTSATNAMNAANTASVADTAAAAQVSLANTAYANAQAALVAAQNETNPTTAQTDVTNAANAYIAANAAAGEVNVYLANALAAEGLAAGYETAAQTSESLVAAAVTAFRLDSMFTTAYTNNTPGTTLDDGVKEFAAVGTMIAHITPVNSGADPITYTVTVLSNNSPVEVMPGGTTPTSITGFTNVFSINNSGNLVVDNPLALDGYYNPGGIMINIAATDQNTSATANEQLLIQIHNEPGLTQFSSEVSGPASTYTTNYTGTAADQFIIGAATTPGQVLSDGGFAGDVILGSNYSDTINVTNSNFQYINGGSAGATLDVGGSVSYASFNIDFTNFGTTGQTVNNITAIQLDESSTGGGNSVTLNAQSVFNTTDAADSNTLTVSAVNNAEGSLVHIVGDTASDVTQGLQLAGGDIWGVTPTLTYTGVVNGSNVTLNVNEFSAGGSLSSPDAVIVLDATHTVAPTLDTQPSDTATAGNEFLLGTISSSQTLIDGGFSGDILIGNSAGYGNTISVSNSNFSFLDGGTETSMIGEGNVLQLLTSSTSFNVDFTTLPNNVRNIDGISLGGASGGVGNSVTLNVQDVFDMTNAADNHTLQIVTPGPTNGGSAVNVVTAALDIANPALGFTLTSGGGIAGTTQTYTGVYNSTTVTLVINDTSAAGPNHIAVHAVA